MKKIKGFTLIELLIVMGILVILISISISVGRYAIRRSNMIQHMSAAQELERVLVKYKVENKEVPEVTQEEFFAYSLGYSDSGENMLEEFLEEPFDGGTDATYYYGTDELGQFFVVCVSLGGIDDEAGLGYYCTGTGIGFVPEDGDYGPITKENIDATDPEDQNQVATVNSMDDSDWEDGKFGW